MRAQGEPLDLDGAARHLARARRYTRAELAEALGLKENDIGERPLWVKAGKEQLVVPLTSTDAVRRASPVPCET